MDGLFAGLGLDNLEGVDLFEDPKKKEEEAKAEAKHVVQESDFIYEKSLECPVCGAKAINKIPKTSKARLLGNDRDLRPIHEGIDTQKYDVLLCHTCGYAALSRFFSQVTSAQAKLIKENITPKVVLHEYNGETYSYEDAIERYKLALANAVVKHAKNSEKAYISLKSAWIYRGYAKSLEEAGGSDAAAIEEAHKMEALHLQNAYKGFAEALSTESFPMCGMDEVTMDYLLGVLAYQNKDYERSSKFVAKVLTAPGATSRIKDKARDLKDDILRDMKKK
ncbi:MAG: DUF2225 domain-containing protein [Butyrivibrio sp.]|nr:DUF2225 domain-containing protein [Muribaculum sp.]MCM1552376.1 DUF2225 domain-containing protein [Butyrivibrio sp.]